MDQTPIRIKGNEDYPENNFSKLFTSMSFLHVKHKLNKKANHMANKSASVSNIGFKGW